MKKIVLISTFCDTEEKIKVLKENLVILKDLGLDTLIISPVILPNDIVEISDFVFFTKENPILDWPHKAMFSWKELTLNETRIKITRTYADYGWAGLYQVKKLSEIALSLDYDYFYHMIYDLKFDKNVIEGLLSERECDVYSSKRGDTVWEVGLHFMIFNRENLKKFIPHITLQNYLNSKGDDAFVWLHRLINIFPYNIVKKPVEDKIYYYEGHDFFNSSPIDGINFFVEKNDEIVETIKILFYNIFEPKEVKIIFNGDVYNYTFHKDLLIDLGFDKFTIPTVLFEYLGVQYDITEKIKKIKHNTINVID